VQLEHGRRGRRAELVAQEQPQPLEGLQRLRHVAPTGLDLHQQHPRRLAVGLVLDELGRGALRRGQLRAAEGEPRATARLQQARPQVGEARARDPLALEPGQQVVGHEGEAAVGGGARRLRLAGGQRRVGLGRLALGDLHVDLGPVVQPQAELAAAHDDIAADGVAHAREHHVEPGARGTRGVARPQDVDQLVAADRPLAVERQAGEERPRLRSLELGGDVLAAHRHLQIAAQPDEGQARAVGRGDLRETAPPLRPRREVCTRHGQIVGSLTGEVKSNGTPVRTRSQEWPS
jgi:hypothetical protein